MAEDCSAGENDEGGRGRGDGRGDGDKTVAMRQVDVGEVDAGYDEDLWEEDATGRRRDDDENKGGGRDRGDGRGNGEGCWATRAANRQMHRGHGA